MHCVMFSIVSHENGEILPIVNSIPDSLPHLRLFHSLIAQIAYH